MKNQKNGQFFYINCTREIIWHLKKLKHLLRKVILVLLIIYNSKTDINAKDKNNKTPFHLADQNCHLSVVEYTVNQKVDINAKD